MILILVLLDLVQVLLSDSSSQSSTAWTSGTSADKATDPSSSSGSSSSTSGSTSDGTNTTDPLLPKAKTTTGSSPTCEPKYIYGLVVVVGGIAAVIGASIYFTRPTEDNSEKDDHDDHDVHESDIKKPEDY